MQHNKTIILGPITDFPLDTERISEVVFAVPAGVHNHLRIDSSLIPPRDSFARQVSFPRALGFNKKTGALNSPVRSAPVRNHSGQCCYSGSTSSMRLNWFCAYAANNHGEHSGQRLSSARVRNRNYALLIDRHTAKAVKCSFFIVFSQPGCFQHLKMYQPNL